MEDNNDLDWPSLVFDEQFLAAVDKLAGRRFGDGGLAEEAATYVIEYLSDSDWQRCQSFKGNSQPKTFLVSIASNAIEEFSRKRFGRPRPPTWLQDLGELWVKLWRSLCLERQPLAALVDRFASRGFRETDAVKQAAKVIKARIPNCGNSARDSETVDDIDTLSDSVQAVDDDCCGEQPEFNNPFEAELVMMLRAIVEPEPKNADFTGSNAASIDSIAGSQKSQLAALQAALQLGDQEKIMLRMIFVEGLSKSATSKALGLPAHQAGRMVNDALERIAAALQSCGMDLDSVLDIV